MKAVCLTSARLCKTRVAKLDFFSSSKCSWKRVLKGIKHVKTASFDKTLLLKKLILIVMSHEGHKTFHMTDAQTVYCVSSTAPIQNNGNAGCHQNFVSDMNITWMKKWMCRVRHIGDRGKYTHLCNIYERANVYSEWAFLMDKCYTTRLLGNINDTNQSSKISHFAS